MEEGPPPSVPMAELFRDHWRETLGGTFGAVVCFAIFYLTTAFALGYGTTSLGYDREAFLGVQLAAILFMALGIALSGWFADLTSAGRVLGWGCVGAILTGMLLAPALASGSLLAIWAFLSFALLVMGFVYGPLGAWLPGLFPARVRYTGSSIAFNVGGIIGGALTPVAAQALADQGGLGWVGVYLAVAALVSLIAIITLRGRG